MPTTRQIQRELRSDSELARYYQPMSKRARADQREMKLAQFERDDATFGYDLTLCLGGKEAVEAITTKYNKHSDTSLQAQPSQASQTLFQNTEIKPERSETQEFHAQMKEVKENEIRKSKYMCVML